MRISTITTWLLAAASSRAGPTSAAQGPETDQASKLTCNVAWSRLAAYENRDMAAWIAARPGATQAFCVDKATAYLFSGSLLFIPYSDASDNLHAMAPRQTTARLLALAALLPCIAGGARAAEAPVAAAQPKPVCVAENETREEIKSHHLLEPFVVLKSASASLKAEALRARLCQMGDEFVYEITLLHRDGRVMHVVMSAVTGKRLASHLSRETPPKP